MTRDFRRLVVFGLAALAACGQEPAAPTAPAASSEGPSSEAPAAEEVVAGSAIVISQQELQDAADSIALVPSPVETQRALLAAGIETQLTELMSDREYDMDTTTLENAAVRTGVILADTLLSVRIASKDTLVGNLDKIRTGMEQLSGGEDIDGTISELQDRIRNEAITTDQLLAEFDVLAGPAIQELEFNGQVRTVPLIQAGAWLEGANLVAKAVKAKGNAGAAVAKDIRKTESKADDLLKQPRVVDYFIEYVRGEGAERAPAGVAEKLEGSLLELKGVAGKSEELSEADIDTVIKVTDDVLALL